MSQNSLEAKARVECDYHGTLLLAITPSKQCVGIEIFSGTYDTQNVDEPFDKYVERCVDTANHLKWNIENGRITEFGQYPNIITNIRSNTVNINHVIDCHNKFMADSIILKKEGELLDLNRVIVTATFKGRFNLNVSCTALVEMCGLVDRSQVTPLMVKKNPQIVENIEKMTRFNCTELESRCEIIRHVSNVTLDKFKALMNFNGFNEPFVEHVKDLSELLLQLTPHLTNEQRRDLTSDPEDNLPVPLPGRKRNFSSEFVPDMMPH